MQIARVFGIPLRVHWSLSGLVVALIGFALWMGGSLAAMLAALIAGILLGSVALHELGHAVAAKRFGIETHHITLYPFGGIAAIAKIPEDPWEELIIALAGPAVNFALAALFAWLWLATDAGWAEAAIRMNLVMGAFNLIPAFPMDGGRVLRALLARRRGWVPASMLAIRIGRAFAYGFIGWGVLTMNLGMLMVGAFLLVALVSEKQNLVSLVWERSYYGQDDWSDPHLWGKKARVDPRT